MRVLAVDPGTVRVGLALSDETETLATPLEVLRGGPAIVSAVVAVARARDAGMVLVGLPVNMDGSEGPEASAARRLAAAIEGASGLPVELWDERLTTVQAERQRRGRARGVRRPSRALARRHAVDAEAAAILLQSYLDRGAARR